MQVTLRKENGSFGMVVRGGYHDVIRKCRPFTVCHLQPNGPTFMDGTIRCGDRILTVNGVNVRNFRLPEFQVNYYSRKIFLIRNIIDEFKQCHAKK